MSLSQYVGTLTVSAIQNVTWIIQMQEFQLEYTISLHYFSLDQ